MVSVYVDTGGWSKALRALENAGVIKTHYYPFEQMNRKVGSVVPGSGATWSQCGDLTWANDPGTLDDDELSSLFGALKAITGSKHVDAQHLDSAYKASCTVFITSDKDDIWSKRQAILDLTGMHVVLPDQVAELEVLCQGRVASTAAT
jgi:hypothetical protein